MGALRQNWWLPIAIVGAFSIPLLADSYSQYVVNLVLVNVVVAIGLNIVMGFAGQLSFAHSAFMGIGAYATVLLMSRVGLPFILALPLAGIATGLLGFLVGLPAVRVRGLYLALLTIAFLSFCSWVFVHWKEVTLGSTGMRVPRVSVGGIPLATDQAKYYAILAATAVMVWLATAIVRSRWGRAFVMVREVELAAQANEINVMTTKAIAFGISAAYAAVGGGLFALAIDFLVPSSFGLLQMVTQFAMVLIGGLTSIVGAMIGALLLSILPELLREFRGAEEIAYGVLIVVFILFMPDGIAGLLRRRGWLPRPALLSRRLEGLRPGISSTGAHGLLPVRKASAEGASQR